MGAIANIGVSVTARVSKFLKGMKKAGRGLKGFSSKISATRVAVRAMGAAMIGLGVGTVVGFVKVLQSGERFNKSMSKSTSIMTGLTTAMRKDMVDASLEMARVSVFSSSQVAEAFFFLASAGLDTKRSLAALPAVVEFAQAGMFDLSLATSLLTDAQSAMGLKVKDAAKNLKNMTRVSDVLVKANQKADATVQEFSEALTTKAAASARFLGISLEEVVAVLAVFADRGVKGAEAGTAFNIVTRDLTTKLIKNRDAFKEAGISIFTAEGKMRSMADIIRNITQRLSGLSVEAKKEKIIDLGFTDRSSNFLLNLLGSGDKISKIMTELIESSGSAARVAAGQFTEWDKAVASMEATWSSFGIKFKPVTEGIANVIVDFGKTIQEEFLDKFDQKTTAELFSRFINIFSGANILAKRAFTGAKGFTSGIIASLSSFPGADLLIPNIGQATKDVASAITAESLGLVEDFSRLTRGEKTNLAGEEFAATKFERRLSERLAAQEFAAQNDITEQFVKGIDESLSKLLKVEDASSIKILNSILGALTSPVGLGIVAQ